MHIFGVLKLGVTELLDWKKSVFQSVQMRRFVH